jgi:hypothetical protein
MGALLRAVCFAALRIRCILCQVGGDLGELVEGRLQVFHYFGGEDGGVGEVVGAFQAFVARPGDIEA